MITFLGTIIFAVIIGIGSLDGRSGLALLGKYTTPGTVGRRARPGQATGVEGVRARAEGSHPARVNAHALRVRSGGVVGVAVGRAENPEGRGAPVAGGAPRGVVHG